MKEKLLTQKQTLEIVNLSRQVVYELRKKGLFPQPVKFHGFSGLRFRNSDIQAVANGEWNPPIHSSDS